MIAARDIWERVNFMNSAKQIFNVLDVGTFEFCETSMSFRGKSSRGSRCNDYVGEQPLVYYQPSHQEVSLQ